jgi:hypothetical protein
MISKTKKQMLVKQSTLGYVMDDGVYTERRKKLYECLEC